MSNLALSERTLGRLSEAEPHLEQALELVYLTDRNYALVCGEVKLPKRPFENALYEDVCARELELPWPDEDGEGRGS